MDPEAALFACRDAVAAYERASTAGDHVAADTAADELVTAFAGLDQWLSKGGFPPRDWAPEVAL